MLPENSLLKEIQTKIEALSSVDELLISSYNQAYVHIFGIDVKQETSSLVLYLEEGSYSQAISKSQFLSLSSCCFDDYHGKVETYFGKKPEDIKTAKPSYFTYDEYIAKAGKLNQKNYYVKKGKLLPKEVIHETYQANKQEDSTLIQNVLIYEINEKSIHSLIRNKDNSITGKLNPIYSHPYALLQMKYNGDLDDYPDIKESEITFYFNQNNLSSIKIEETYQAKSGLFSFKAKSITNTSFYLGKEREFDIANQKRKMSIPEKGEMLILT